MVFVFEHTTTIGTASKINIKLNSPRNLLTIEEAEILKKTVLLSVAIALARSVFPHPGDLDIMVSHARRIRTDNVRQHIKIHNQRVDSPMQ